MSTERLARDPERLAGQELRRLRVARGWSQEEVARRMQAIGYDDWHQTMISKIESASRPLRVRELVDFAAVFEVTASDLLCSAAWKWLESPERIDAALEPLEAARKEAARKAAEAETALDTAWKARAELTRTESQIRYLQEMRASAAARQVA